jgi:DNA polymerase-1
MWQDKIRNPNCDLCPLHEGAEFVCLMGQGSRKAKVMIVGEAPGEREDEEHVAFVGPSGQLLRRSLKQVGIDPEDCYITNVAKCRPPDNRNPTKTEAKICSTTYLQQELQRVQPDFILGVGNAPLAAFTRNSGITKHRGKTYGLGVGTFFPTFHPAYVLRSPQHGPTFRSDLQRFARLVRGEEAPAGTRTNAKIVTTKGHLRWLLNKLDQAKVISFDLETSSEGSGKTLRYHQPWDQDGRIVMVGFSWEPGQGVAVPIHHSSRSWRDPDAVLDLFRPALSSPDKKLIAHNGKFDIRWLASRGIFANLSFDTMLACHLLDENRSKALENLSQIIFGVDGWKQGGDITKDAYNADLRTLGIYQAKDVDYTLRLYHHFKAQLIDQPRLARIMAWLMMPASNALTQVESVGMYVHGKRLKKQLVHYRRERDALETEIEEYAGRPINIRSPQQVSRFLFGDLKLNPVKQTKTGNDSTDEHSLLVLKDEHPVMPLILRYRTVDMKYLRTYLEKWDEWRDTRSRVHTTYKLFGTVTGRLSSEKPNLQQVPRESTLRSCFGAPEGWSFVEADYAQIELRIAAMLSDDPVLLRIFHTGGDPHLSTAAQISGLTEAEVQASDRAGKTEHRKRAKPVNFGFLYEMGEDKFIDYAFDNYGITVTPQEAHDYRKAYFDLYSRLPAWHDRQKRLANQYGRVVSPLGRVRHLPDIGSNEKQVRAEAERQAINSPVQSTASDLMLVSLVRMVEEFHPSVARAVGTVHDSILAECKDSEVEETTQQMRHIMEVEALRLVKKKFGANITVPIKVDIKVGKYWGAS